MRGSACCVPRTLHGNFPITSLSRTMCGTLCLHLECNPRRVHMLYTLARPWHILTKADACTR